MNRNKLIIGATALSTVAAVAFPIIAWANRANLRTQLSTQPVPAAGISVQTEDTPQALRFELAPRRTSWREIHTMLSEER